jgi:hypothetical protein
MLLSMGLRLISSMSPQMQPELHGISEMALKATQDNPIHVYPADGVYTLSRLFLSAFVVMTPVLLKSLYKHHRKQDFLIRLPVIASL